MRRIVVLALGGAALATAFATAPASATCMENFDYGGIVRSWSCSPPGGPVTTTTCVYDVCWTNTSGGGGGGGDT